jgi:hypothetical protein
MEEFKEKQKRQRVIVVEKLDYNSLRYKVVKVYTNATKCYKIHFRAFFQHCEDNKEVNYQKFLNTIKMDDTWEWENKDFYGDRVRFRYTIHQLE